MSPTDIRTALSEQRKARSRGSWWNMLKATGSEWSEDNATTWAAAVACYTLLALAPLLVIAIKVGTVLLRGKIDDVSRAVVDFMGPATGDAIREIMHKIQQQGGGIAATVISAAVTVASVGGVFAELQQAMNRIWKIKPKPGQALWGFVRARLKSVVVMGIAALLLLASVVVATWLGHFTAKLGPVWKYVSWVVDVAVSVGVLTLLFALLYRTVPDAQIAWRTTWVGAFMSALLFEIGKYGLALYFKYGTPTSAFGAVGSLAAILIWIYYSAQIVFFGAEFTQVYAKSRGQGVHPSRHAQFLKECDETETATPSSSEPHEKPARPGKRPGRGPAPSRQYGAVLAPHAPRAGPARAMHPPTYRQSLFRSYLAGGAGLLMGALIGAQAALKGRRRSEPRGKDIGAARLEERIKRVEQKVGHVSRIRKYLEQEDVNERIDALEHQIREAARCERKAARQRRSGRWTDRILDAVKARV